MNQLYPLPVADRTAQREGLARIQRLRSDRSAIKSCASINGRWIACQVDAGMFGDDYAGMVLPDAVDWIEAVIVDELSELAAMREDRMQVGRG